MDSKGEISCCDRAVAHRLHLAQQLQLAALVNRAEGTLLTFLGCDFYRGQTVKLSGDGKEITTLLCLGLQG